MGPGSHYAALPLTGCDPRKVNNRSPNESNGQPKSRCRAMNVPGDGLTFILHVCTWTPVWQSAVLSSPPESSMDAGTDLTEIDARLQALQDYMRDLDTGHWNHRELYQPQRHLKRHEASSPLEASLGPRHSQAWALLSRVNNALCHLMLKSPMVTQPPPVKDIKPLVVCNGASGPIDVFVPQLYVYFDF